MTQKNLSDNLVAQGILKNPRIIAAFQKIDRRDFADQNLSDLAYLDYPLPIYGGQTISQPTTVGFMLELLDPKPGHKILDVGSGSGWTTALLAKIMGSKGQVFGVERISKLVEFGRNNLDKYKLKNASIKQAGRTLGLPKQAPFDRILVSAASQTIPQELVEQLAQNGTMVIPVQNSILKITKTPDNKISIQEFPGFIFVPLKSD